MNIPIPDTILALAGLLPAALLLIPSLSPWMWDEGKLVAKRATGLASIGFLASVLVAAAILVRGPLAVNLLDFGGAGLSIYLDRLSLMILVMVSFLGVIVTRYTINHLAGDEGQARFVRRLSVTIATVQILSVSGNLLMFTLAWTATSLSLHRLLVFFPDRAGAKLAAKKKFLISRAGDLCLIAVLALVWQQFGSWEFSKIFAAMNSGTVAVGAAIPLLLALGALMKSAQLPFHSWLPETMESPTPVSALMHAGIINAGGFLILRLSPLVAGSGLAMDLLIAVGGITAVVASLVMITQTSIKRALAWSTISQMGFMMLQCGLGAFGLAALHILAHSLYKAHAFLSAGGVVARASKRSAPSQTPDWATWGISMAIALGLSALGLAATGSLAHLSGSEVLLTGVLAIALAQLMASARISALPGSKLGWGVGLSGLVIAIVLSLHLLTHAFFDSLFGSVEVAHTQLAPVLMGVVLALLFAVIFLQTQLGRGTRSPRLQKLYIHASHGFYFGTYFARLLGVKGSKVPAKNA